MNQAPVSVVIPCYNCAATLSRAFESVMAQSLPPAEVIFVDDCSTDHTLRVIEELVAVSPSARVVRLQRNSGAAAARNAGWAVAIQPYVAFLDSDDSWCPDKISKQLAVMMSDPSIALSGHLVGSVSGSGGATPVIRRISLFRLMFRNCFLTPTVMVRRQSPHRFDEGLPVAEDYDLWLRIVADDGIAVLIDDALAVIHKRPYGAGGLSRQIWRMHWNVWRAFWGLRRKEKVGVVTFLFAAFYYTLKTIRKSVKSIAWKIVDA